MRFDIEGFITFDTEEASLVNLLTGDCIELSATSTRLLTNLLQYRGDIISRVDIFQSVFEKYGARPSNSNLNQYISTLRRSLADLGIEKSGLDRLIQCSYELLGLISFLTYGKDECRAWTIKKGTKAPQAAGKIHSDIERGFIRAETINFDEMMACGGSVAAAKEKGLLRSEGKEYVVKDGDMIYFRFNV